MAGLEGDIRAKKGSTFDQRLKWINGSEYEGMDKQTEPWSKYISKRRVNHTQTLESGSEDQHRVCFGNGRLKSKTVKFLTLRKHC